MNSLFIILVFGLVFTTFVQVCAEYRPIRLRAPRVRRVQARRLISVRLDRRCPDLTVEKICEIPGRSCSVAPVSREY
jgi:hypothetical protein